VGTSVFASIGKEPLIYVQILVGLISILASVLSTLAAFLNYSELAVQHQKAGVGFAAIRKELEELLAFAPNQQSELESRLAAIRKKWDKLREETVPISSEIVKVYQRQLVEGKS